MAEHRHTAERTSRCTAPMVLVGACGAATAAVAARGTRAAAPLALSAALNLGLIVSAPKKVPAGGLMIQMGVEDGRLLPMPFHRRYESLSRPV